VVGKIASNKLPFKKVRVISGGEKLCEREREEKNLILIRKRKEKKKYQ